jgi:HEAT repeat protein
VEDAIGPLTQAAYRPVLAVRIPALRGLGRIGREGRFDSQIRPIALSKLRDLFADRDVDHRVRAAAADAIGDIVAPTGNMEPSIYLILREGMGDAHMEVRRAAAKAIGKASFPKTPTDLRTQVMIFHRVHPPIELVSE